MTGYITRKSCRKGSFAAIKPYVFSIAVRGLLIWDFENLDDTDISFSKSRFGLEEKLFILVTCPVAPFLFPNSPFINCVFTITTYSDARLVLFVCREPVLTRYPRYVSWGDVVASEGHDVRAQTVASEMEAADVSPSLGHQEVDELGDLLTNSHGVADSTAVVQQGSG